MLPLAHADYIDAFEIYRREKGLVRFELIGNRPAELNTLGVTQSYYEFIDTLSSEKIYY